MQTDQSVTRESRVLLGSEGKTVLQDARGKKDLWALRGPQETRVTQERMAPR